MRVDLVVESLTGSWKLPRVSPSLPYCFEKLSVFMYNMYNVLI